MSTELAALAAAAVFLFAGFGLLSALGMLSGGIWKAVALTGLAYISGLAATLLVGIVLLCTGASFGVSAFVAIGALIGGAGYGTAIWRAGARPAFKLPGLAVRRHVREHPIAVLVALVFGCIAIAGYYWARPMPLTVWDAWSIWARKATLLFHFGTLRPEFFSSSSYAFMHPDYPLLVPLLESVWFRLVGTANTQSLHVEFWILYVAALWAAAGILMGHARAALWVPIIGFAAFAPAITGQLMSMYADVPMAALLMLGVLLLGLRLADGQRSHLLLAAIFLAASANTKNEGLTYAICALAIAGAVTLVAAAPGRRAADLRRWSAGAIGFAILVAPWRIWLAVHHVGGDMPIGKGLDPSYLAHRTSRIGPTLTALYGQLTNTGKWSYLLPVAIAVVLACLISRRLSRPAAFYALTGIGVFVILVWAYVINPAPIHWYLATSASRTIDGLMFVGVAALLHLPSSLMPASAHGDTLGKPSLAPGARHEATLVKQG